MGSTQEVKLSIWHDCDPGHDDAMSIILAAQTPGVKVLGISTVAGNTLLDRCTQNALSVLNAIGRNDIDVVAGQDRPLLCQKFVVPQIGKDIHGEGGMDSEAGNELFSTVKKTAIKGSQTQNCIQIMFESIKREYLQRYKNTDKKVYLVATGPLTNVALLLILYPEVKDYIEISIMGGCIAPGNGGPVQEYNIMLDPEAAKYVLDSGIKITIIPLEVTHKAVVSQEVLQLLMSPQVTPFKSQVKDLLMYFQSTYKQVFNMDYPPLHDPCATAYVIDPTIFKTKLMRIDVEVNSELTRGQLVLDFFEKSSKLKNVYWCEDINLDRFWSLVKISVDRANKDSLLNIAPTVNL